MIPAMDQSRFELPMYDLTALGEILIDFTPAGDSPQGNACFEQNPGGAPANVLACVAKLGGRTAFIGKVGEDLFGRYLESVLRELEIETRGLRFTETVRTTLAFVALDRQGERSFSFYRNPGADSNLSFLEVDQELIRNAKAFHFGSLSLTDQPAREATFKAAELARSSGCLVTYDPNLRLMLWSSEAEALHQIRQGLRYPHILKISNEELTFLTGEQDLSLGSKLLYREYQIPVILVTLGSKGCFYRYADLTGRLPAFTSLKTVDTTGAGDAFLGGFLFSILRQHSITTVDQFDREILEDAITFANATAALCITGRGAIPALPNLREVENIVPLFGA